MLPLYPIQRAFTITKTRSSRVCKAIVSLPIPGVFIGSPRRRGFVFGIALMGECSMKAEAAI